MTDDVIQYKTARIERCVKRAREEYNRNPETFERDYTRQDAAILNIQRACEAALDMGQHLIRRDGLGLPQSARDVFSLLAKAGRIDTELSDALRRMVGFRNIALHDYQSMHLPITIKVITEHLDDFLLFSETVLRNEQH